MGDAKFHATKHAYYKNIDIYDEERFFINRLVKKALLYTSL